MASFNKVILLGNMARDPEMRTTPGGLAICKFTVAVNRKFKTQQGEEREEVAFVDVDSFGKQAECISQYFGKGKPILVEGRLKQDKWEDKNTQEKRSKLLVVLESFSFCGGKREDDSSKSASHEDEDGRGHYQEPSSAPVTHHRHRSEDRSAPPSGRRPPPPGDNIDEDVPF